MLFSRILVNLSLLLQGKMRISKIPPKIINRAFNYSRLARHIKRDRFAIHEVIFRAIEQNDESNYCEFFNHSSNEITPTAERKTFIPKSNNEYLCYIALYRNKIVGKVELRKTLSDADSIWRVGGLSILRDFRGFGIGEELLKEAISAIPENNPAIFLGLDKDNLRALKLYRKLGFRVPTEHEKSRIKSIPYPSKKIMMVKGV